MIPEGIAKEDKCRAKKSYPFANQFRTASFTCQREADKKYGRNNGDHYIQAEIANPLQVHWVVPI